MKRTKWIAGLVGVAAVAIVGFTARADGEPQGPPTPQKPIDSPYLKSLVGSWTTAMTATFGGGPTTGAGTATYRLSIGGTALLEDYETTMQGMGAFSGHMVAKVSPDGKSLAFWWFDVHTAEPSKWTGTLTETGFDVKTEYGPMGPTRITMSKTEKGHEFKMYDKTGTVVMTDVFTAK
jgi:hypothetical protein